MPDLRRDHNLQQPTRTSALPALLEQSTARPTGPLATTNHQPPTNPKGTTTMTKHNPTNCTDLNCVCLAHHQGATAIGYTLLDGTDDIRLVTLRKLTRRQLAGRPDSLLATTLDRRAMNAALARGDRPLTYAAVNFIDPDQVHDQVPMYYRSEFKRLDDLRSQLDDLHAGDSDYRATRAAINDARARITAGAVVRHLTDSSPGRLTDIQQRNHDPLDGAPYDYLGRIHSLTKAHCDTLTAA